MCKAYQFPPYVSFDHLRLGFGMIEKQLNFSLDNLACDFWCFLLTFFSFNLEEGNRYICRPERNVNISHR